MIGREYIPVQVKVWHIKDGKKKQGDYIEFEVYPPIYVKNIILNPKEIEEGQFAQLDVEISNLKDVEVYVYARSKRDLLNTERGTETASGNVASFSKDKKVRFYIYTQTGENSISFDSIPEHMIDFDQWKKDTMADLIHSGIDTGFSYSKYGKMAQGWAGDWGDAVGNLDQAKFYGKSFVGTPSNYSPMNWAFMGWDEQAAKIGASKTASEGFWNFMVLVVDGTKFTVGILSGSLPGSKWGSNARNNAVNAYFNAVKEMFKQTADATRVANSIEVQYPKVLFLELEDEDGYIITGKVPYYVIRHE